MSSRRRWPAVLVALCGVACLVTSVVLFADRPPVDAGAVPAPGPPVPIAVQRPGAVPVEFALPGRGITAPVVPVGTDPAGGLVPPDPPRTVGWWAPGALAGSGAGSVVLAGHVDSATAGFGALVVLRELVEGEPVVLRGADGRAFSYRVAARRQYAKAALPPDVFARDGAPRLVLVTCGGRFDPATRSYDDNVVVYAVPVRAATDARGLGLQVPV